MQTSLQIHIRGKNVTINAGAGNDYISNSKGNNVTFIYNDGDGFDTISGFNDASTLSIGNGTGTYSTVANGSDIVVTVGDGSITLVGSANLSTVKIAGREQFYWTLNGTTATYGSLVVNGVKSTSGLSISGKVVTVSKSSLGTGNVTVSDGYTLKPGNDVSAPATTAANWTLNGTTATYKSDSATAGYTLANNTISYSAAKAASTLATVSGKVVTVSKASLGTDDVTISVAGKYITLKSGAGNDKLVSTGSHISISASGGHNYVSLGANSSDQTVRTGAGNDSIVNSGENVTINGGAGNDYIWNEAGVNVVFQYNTGDGNDKIFNYGNEDIIRLASGTSIKKSAIVGSYYVFTIGNGKISVVGGASKRIHVVDANGNDKWYSDSSSDPVTVSGKKVTLTEDFSDYSFNVNSYDGITKTVAAKIATIDASAVNHTLEITGNKLANHITGTAEDDYIDGGAAADKLFGGDGNDKIFNYGNEDIIRLASGTSIKSAKASGKNYVFTIGSGKVSVVGGASKYIHVVDGSGNRLAYRTAD
ncbi:MAG: hypothetical protein SR1Q7_02525 [Quinella sp. 1Q7]|nr:hypothetical protein [Quinella sp. 1Q7]